GVVDLAVEIHEAADGGAVHVRDRREIDEDLALARGDQAADRRRKVGKDRIHEPRLADADDRDTAGLFGFDIHQWAPVRLRIALLGPESSPRNLRIWRASSVRPRVMGDVTVPSGSRSLSAISW